VFYLAGLKNSALRHDLLRLGMVLAGPGLFWFYVSRAYGDKFDIARFPGRPVVMKVVCGCALNFKAVINIHKRKKILYAPLLHFFSPPHLIRTVEMVLQADALW